MHEIETKILNVNKDAIALKLSDLGAKKYRRLNLLLIGFAQEVCKKDKRRGICALELTQTANLK